MHNLNYLPYSDIKLSNCFPINFILMLLSRPVVNRIKLQTAYPALEELMLPIVQIKLNPKCFIYIAQPEPLANTYVLFYRITSTKVIELRLLAPRKLFS